MPNPYRIGLRPVKQPCRKDTFDALGLHWAIVSFLV
jgi:hypothetical protein